MAFRRLPKWSAPARRATTTSWHQDVRLRRDPDPSHRKGDGPLRHESQGQGQETTYAQIIAEELGLPASDVEVEEGNTDTAPYGLGTYASRSTPTAGAAGAMAAHKIKAKAKKIASYLLEVNEDDLEWSIDRFRVKGAPDQHKTIQDIALAAYTNYPPGMEAGLEATDYYDPPNLTFPFGSYICVVDIDKGTGEVKVRRFIAVDDCGNIINPMVVEGQIHGGLTMGLAPALYEEIVYENGQNLTGTFSDYLVPTAVESPQVGDRPYDHPISASPTRRQRCGGITHGWRATGDRQRGRGCALAFGCAAHQTSRLHHKRCGSCCGKRGSPTDSGATPEPDRSTTTISGRQLNSLNRAGPLRPPPWCARRHQRRANRGTVPSSSWRV